MTGGTIKFVNGITQWLSSPDHWMRIQSIGLWVVLLIWLTVLIHRRMSRDHVAWKADQRYGFRGTVQGLWLDLLFAYFFWTVFYSLSWLPLCKPGLLTEDTRNFLGHILTNTSTLFLVRAYVRLAAPKRHGNKSKEFTGVLGSAALILFVATTCLEALVSWQGHWSTPVAERSASFVFISGIAQSLALFLIAGRLEDAVIADHLRRVQSITKLRLYRSLLFLVFLYAAIQPLYIYFSNGEYQRIVSGLIILSFFLKLSLLCLFLLLSLPRKDRLTTLEFYLYEVTRFSTEDLRSYEREFFRHYLPARYEELLRHNHVGFIGIDFIYPTAYKRWYLGHNYSYSGRLGGMLVRNIHRRSNALERGLRMGDFITHVNELPVGPNNTLFKLLENHPPKSKVTLTFLRLRDGIEKPTAPGDYLEHDIEVRLGTADIALSQKSVHPMLRPYLGISFREQATYIPAEPSSNAGITSVTKSASASNAGIVCRDEPGTDEQLPRDYVLTDITTSSGVCYRVADQQALRFIAMLCVPGSTIERHVRVGDNTTRPGRTVRLVCETETNAPRLANNGSYALRMLNDHAVWIRRILKIDPDRFVTDAEKFGPITDLADITLGHKADKALRVMLFDVHLDIVFEYESPAGQLQTWLNTSPVWQYIDPGDLFMFIGPLPVKATGKLGTNEVLLASGGFLQVRVARTPKINT